MECSLEACEAERGEDPVTGEASGPQVTREEATRVSNGEDPVTAEAARRTGTDLSSSRPDASGKAVWHEGRHRGGGWRHFLRTQRLVWLRRDMSALHRVAPGAYARRNRGRWRALEPAPGMRPSTTIEGPKRG